MASTDTGRIIFTDPNDIPGIGKTTDGKKITWDPEDLNLYVDLSVEIPGRTNGSTRDNTASNTTLSGNFSYGRQSFFSGSILNDKLGNKEEFLTDSFTEVSYHEIRNNREGAKENLGVDSISINFDSHMYPRVKMKFIDIRGYSLFAPNEMGDNIPASKRFFNALFHFPYPKFYLTVKGFYGTKVTFILSVDEFKSGFNADSGHFEANVSFIGNMYGFYTDLPMNYIIAAPYINQNGDGTNEYWRSQVANGEFTYDDGTGHNGAPIHTFIEFKQKFGELTDSINGTGSTGISDENIAKIKEYGIKINDLKPLCDGYEEVLSGIKRSNSGIDYRGSEGNLYIISDNYKSITIKPNAQDFVEKYNARRNENYGYLPELPEIFTKTLVNDAVALKEYYSSEANRYEFHDTKQDGDSTVYGLKIEGGEAYKTLFEEYNTAVKERNTLLDSGDEALDKVLREKLGFSPNIENIFRMIFAHVDTFFHEFFQLKSEIESDADRTFDKLGLRTDNSDINSYRTTNKNVKCEIPPFPLVTENNSGEFKRVYPGNMVGALSDISEVHFIDKINRGLQNMAINYGTPSTDTSMIVTPDNSVFGDIDFKPISLMDFSAGDNPYRKLGLEKDGDAHDVIRKAIWFLAARWKTAFSLGDKVLYNINKVMVAEAENLYNAYGGYVNNNEGFWQEVENSAKNFNFEDYGVKKNVSNQDINEYPYHVSYQRDTATYSIFIRDLKNTSADIADEKVYAVLDQPYEDSKKYSEFTKNGITIDGDLKRLENIQSKLALVENEKTKTIESNFSFYAGINHLETTDAGAPFDSFDKDCGEKIKKMIDGDGAYVIPYLASVFHRDGALVKDYIEPLFNKIKLAYNKLDGVSETTISGKTVSYEELRSMVTGYIMLSALVGKNYNIGFKDSIAKKIPYITVLFQSAVYKFNKEKIDNVDKTLFDFFFETWDNSSKDKGNTIINGDGNVIYNTNGINLETEIVDTKYFDEWLSNDSAKKIIKYCKDYIDNPSSTGYTYFNEATFKIKGKKIYENSNNEKPKFLNLKGEVELQNAFKSLLTKQVYAVNIRVNQRFASLTKENVELFLTEFKSYHDKKVEAKEQEETSTGKILGDTSNAEELYYSLKNFYDRWIPSVTDASIFNLESPQEVSIKRNKRFVTHEKVNITEYSNFIFVDSFYRDISKTFLIDLGVLMSLIDGHMTGDSNMSLMEFITYLAQKNKLLFIALPVYTNSFTNIDSFQDIFRPHQIYDCNDTLGVGNTYVLMYTYQPAKMLEQNIEENDAGYTSDGIDLMDFNELSTTGKSKFGNNDDGINFKANAFAVKFGEQYQSYFKNVGVNMDNPRVTDVSIANTLKIAQEGRYGDVGTGISQGDNLYSVFSNKSYNCTVEMMGCINIMPTMYFQMNNINLFHGLYQVMSVEHTITNGDMVTRFTGQKISKEQLNSPSNVFNFRRLLQCIGGGGTPSETYTSISNCDGIYKSTSAGGNKAPRNANIWTKNGLSLNINPATNEIDIAPVSQEFLDKGYKFYANNAVAMMKVYDPAIGKVPYNNTGSTRSCATCTKTFISAGFHKSIDGLTPVDVRTNGNFENKENVIIPSSLYRPCDGYTCDAYLPTIGFKPVYRTMDLNEFKKQIFQQGDVATMENPSGGSEVGHICMYDGEKWVSDFRQNNCWIYTKSGKVPTHDIIVFRYAGEVVRNV